MFRNARIYNPKRIKHLAVYIQRQSFLTNDYKCDESWKKQTLSPTIDQINLNDFYNKIDVQHSSKGVISAVDVDIFANAIKDASHLDELRDLLHRLRLSAETGHTLESTHHATIRNYIEYGNIQDLLSILKDPLNYGLFLDEFSANILLDKLIKSSDFEQAANVAALIMLQEDYNNEITCSLCLYACFKFIKNHTKQIEPELIDDKKKKVDEIKIRVKFLRNPYFDDHFDINDVYTLSGKTLAWISERNSDNLSTNLQIVGWCCYKKYDKLLIICKNFVHKPSSTIYKEVIDFLNKEINSIEGDAKSILENCVSMLSKISHAKEPIEVAIETMIENSINKIQNSDIKKQHQLFQLWSNIREQKVIEQTKRLDRAKRIEFICQKQEDLKNEEQKLWFFENEDAIDLQIEEKETSEDIASANKKSSKKADEDYIPPEIRPMRK
ncbi:unnamed protein product [Diatraea saccharalis]|uniref:Mitochondrial 28S ribosomal protein S27 n=1 Tax=Diatraea saccharalis TaxID=40085 RepID=A0A9N9WHG1_9NEOP|nr:unnamed protein product [Diatraea saccharalis]